MLVYIMNCFNALLYGDFYSHMLLYYYVQILLNLCGEFTTFVSIRVMAIVVIC